MPGNIYSKVGKFAKKSFNNFKFSSNFNSDLTISPVIKIHTQKWYCVPGYSDMSD